MKMVILARGGSKGIPNKNLKKVNGLSLVARSIVTARKSSSVSNVIVSTDSLEIAAEARLFGASVHVRDELSASDTASTEDALDEFLANDTHLTIDDEFFGYMQPTSPFVSYEEIDDAFSILKLQDSISTIFSARETHAFLWGTSQNKKNQSYSVNHQFGVKRARRQEVHDLQLVEDGSFYILRTKNYLKTRNRFGDAPYAYSSKVLCPVEIDTFLDLEICRRIAPLLDNPLALQKQPKLIISDFDGVFTSDNVFLSDTGSESIKCSRADGQGIKKIKEAGIDVIIVSSETNPVAEFRAKKINVPIYLGIADKLVFIRKLVSELNLEMADVAYIGNDLNDLDVLKEIGIPLIPESAAQQLYAEGFSIIPRIGGDGVLRYLADLIE